MHRTIGRLASLAAIGVFLFLGAKGCIVTTWSSPKSLEAYQVQGGDGRSMAMFFLPGHQTMMWYSDPSQPITEGVLTRMRGSLGTHYLGSLWHIDGPGVWFGYRLYPSGTTPVNMEIQVLEKYSSGSGGSSFAEKGDTTHEVMLFSADSVQFGGTVLHRISIDATLVRALLEKLGGSNVPR